MSSQHDADAHAGGPDGPPSWRARESLAARMRGDLADARLRLHETVLRAEAYALLGDDEALADVGREQQALLADLEERFGRTVADAVVERDAEEVVAAAYPAHDGAVVDPGAVPADDDAPRSRPRPVLSGVASAVALFGLASAVVLGVQQGPGTIEVVDAADPGPGAAPTDADVQLPAPDPGWWTVVPVDPATGPTDVGNEVADAAATDAPATTAAEPAAPATTPGRDDDDADDEDTSDSPDLDRVVSDLNEAVERLDGSQLGGSVPSVEDQLPPPPSPQPSAGTDAGEPAGTDAGEPAEDGTEPVDVADDDGFVSGDGGQ